jgi:PAS domain S-box-containing protein
VAADPRTGSGEVSLYDLDLQSIYDSAPAGLAFIDNELRFQRVNAAFAEMYGLPVEAYTGRLVVELPAGAGDELEPLFRLALNTGQALPATEIEGADFGTPSSKRSWLISANPVFSGTSVIGLSVAARETTARKRTEERMALLNSELHHRVKNVLATVQAIARSTARGAESVEAFEQRFSARLSSLAKTHSLLVAKSQDTASVRDLISTELDPYDDQATQRTVIGGPEIELPASQAVPLGMAVHELTTNAAKHGALSMIGGSVNVTWAVHPMPSARLVLRWVEEGGPPVAPPTRHGFGSQLLERVLSAQIGAKVDREFAATGLRVTIEVPLTTAPAQQEG